jgi:hypothetical protein
MERWCTLLLQGSGDSCGPLWPQNPRARVLAPMLAGGQVLARVDKCLGHWGKLSNFALRLAGCGSCSGDKGDPVLRTQESQSVRPHVTSPGRSSWGLPGPCSRVPSECRARLSGLACPLHLQTLPAHWSLSLGTASQTPVL